MFWQGAADNAIGALCKIRGVPFAVDAAQTAGVFPINMKKQGIDYLCIAPHKGLYAPMGIGVLICEKPLKNTVLEGGTVLIGRACTARFSALKGLRAER